MEFNGTFFVTIITFIVFVFVMNKILYVPILGIMEERESVISGNYKSAEDNDKKAAALSEEKTEKLTNAKDAARGKYIEAIEDYKSQKSNIIADAQNIAREDAEKTNIELNNISNKVKEGLKGYMSDLADDIVEKVIGYRSQSDTFDNSKVDEVLWGQNS